ncbi:MAG TPA: glycosyltransferase family A protein [Caulobacteraceae bacterium]|nr:glycosyltransferase family A protein [Caulobacteraceae bacterium]
MPDQPLISCLMVSLPALPRLAGLQRSISDYLRQTWPARELVVVLNGGDAAVATAIRRHVAELGRPDIRIVEPAGALTLGALRNIAKAKALGEIVCQWDDDDLYHPERLERQARGLVASGAEAIGLEQVMQFFPAERELYCDNFRNAPEGAFAGSIMGWASTALTYPESGAAARLGEDTEVVLQVKARGGFAVLSDHAHLYVYVSHGANSWSDAHHRVLPYRHGLTQGLLRRREAELRAGLAAIDFGPDPITVQGSNGPAFVLAGAQTDLG